MPDAVKVGFVPFATAARGTVVVFCDEALKFGPVTTKALGDAAATVKRAAATGKFKGKSAAVLDILAPDGIKASRLIVIGTGKPGDLKEIDLLKFGGVLAGKVGSNGEAVTVMAELASGAMKPAQAASIASGALLRGYRFDRYKTKKKDDEDTSGSVAISIAVDDAAAAKKAFAPDSHIVDGVVLARELVNEPPNVLFPTEFARRAGELKKLGVAVEVLDVKAMEKLGMGALLGVAQGSVKPGRMVVMRWNGGKKGEQPVAFIGKGVTFDTGGISIKSAGGMEDMKGDMGGAACVVGLMHALGVAVEVLDVKAMEKLGMGALLGVAQGSVKPGRMVVMRWNGGKKGEQPVAFIGKGVTFDTGGISIKSAGGMEDMKGDMGGAACVVGLMHALAGRKAKVNVVGAIGIVENMPDGNAQRPGDIVTSMSGQTIEIINTDAEGRLVLADVLWYVAKKYKPKFMVDLATLTGAIMVALGTEYAGMFSNNDELAERLSTVGQVTGERVWRMPLGPEYDKQIDSQFADMKNTGTRNGGSITAAQFLQRFVDGTPWAHLDIAGTAMGAPKTEINQSWGSGYGVRLLDRLVAEYYEAKK